MLLESEGSLPYSTCFIQDSHTVGMPTSWDICVQTGKQCGDDYFFDSCDECDGDCDEKRKTRSSEKPTENGKSH